MSDEILEIHGTQASLLVLRLKRNQKLSESDWTQTNDIVMQNQEEWVAYRSLLRDLPANTEDPTKPEWPEPPQVKKIVPGKTKLEKIQAELTDERALHETTRADLEQTQVNLEATNAKLRDLETTKTQLRDTQTELEVTKLKLANVEARLKIIELTISGS
jgi:hypothetical protein